jgi:hypothetical protein
MRERATTHAGNTQIALFLHCVENGQAAQAKRQIRPMPLKLT